MPYRPATSPPVALTPVPLAANSQGKIFVTDEMEGGAV